MRAVAADFDIVQGDSGPSLKATLEDSDGAAIPLAGGDTVAFELHKVTTGAAVTLAGTSSVVNAAAGTVRYVWAAADTATPGDYTGRFRVTYVDTSKESVPNGAPILVRVHPR